MTSSSNIMLLLLLAVLQVQLCSVFVQASEDSDVPKPPTDITMLFDSTDDIHVGPSVAAILAMVGGTIVCFAGYKLIRPAMFVCAFIVGGVFTAGLVDHFAQNKSYVVAAVWIAFTVGGLLCGATVLCLYELGVFAIGAAAGVFLAFAVSTSAAHLIYPSNPTVVLVVLAIVLGLVGGFLASKLERPVLIVAAAFVGAAAVVWGIGYFGGNYPNAADLKRFAEVDANGKWVYSIPGAWWGYLVGQLVLFAVGMYVQFHKTAAGRNYNRSVRSHKSVAATQQGGSYDGMQTPHYGNPVAHV